MTLRECFDRHKCDKGCRHGYERVYEPVFAPIREQAFTLLEIGVWRGASLAAWLEYLPNATLIGLDTFQRVAPEDIPVLADPRVRWFRGDSTAGVPEGLPEVDFIIDDGCHTAEAQRATLAHFRPFLKPGGRYFIEDAPTLRLPGAIVHDFSRRKCFDSRILELHG